jgi:hypothetical protein
VKVTITLEERVPYAPVAVRRSISMDSAELDDALSSAGDVFQRLYYRLLRSVETAVEAEMKRRGIRLGPDGLRLKEIS